MIRLTPTTTTMLTSSAIADAGLDWPGVPYGCHWHMRLAYQAGALSLGAWDVYQRAYARAFAQITEAAARRQEVA